jgi:hypothetical protein
VQEITWPKRRFERCSNYLRFITGPISKLELPQALGWLRWYFLIQNRLRAFFAGHAAIFTELWDTQLC